MSDTPASLRWSLTWRLSALQAVLLTVLAVLIVAALAATGNFMTLEPEDETIDAIASAVVRGDSGSLKLRETPAFAARSAETPGLWFVVRRHDGATLAYGKVPAAYAEMGAALDRIGQARFGSMLNGDFVPAARLKTVHAAAGDLQILTGANGTVSPGRLLAAVGLLFASVVLPLIAITAIATIIAAPLVVRRALASADAIAARAKQIDVDRRGTRLPSHNVPQEIVPLVEAVNGALARLDDGYEHQRKFFAYLAHEWRTPIAILQTRLDALPAGPEKVLLLQDLARLANLTEQFLDLQRFGHRFEPARINLVAVTRQVVFDLAPLAIAAGYEPVFEADEEMIDVLGDAAAIERAITNLLQNAIQHGGGRGQITTQISRSSGITISDEGEGVPADDRERIFDPFFRVNGHGFGLGLNLVREIVGRRGGRIWGPEAPSGGASFRLILPLLPAG